MKKVMVSFIVIASVMSVGVAFAGNKLFVGNLPFQTTVAQIEPHLVRFGPVNSITVVSKDQNGDQSANAIVEYVYPRDAAAAAAALDGTVVAGRVISAKRREIVVVGSKVKDVIRSAGLRSDGDLVQAVSDKVHELLQAAIARAKGNNRSTVRPHDL